MKMKVMKKNSFKVFLCKFSGEDVYLIQSLQNEKILNAFAFIGFFVFVIFIGCFISVTYFALTIFKGNYITDLLFGLFWGLVISVIYIFLLYTITPALLPTKFKHGKSSINIVDLKKLNFTPSGFVSVFYKYLFILIISIIVSQPLNVLVSSETTEGLGFLEQLKIINDYKIYWFNTFLAFCTFLFPVILKYLVRRFGSFYEKKQLIERKIVEDEYIIFNKKYIELLSKNEMHWNKTIQNNVLPIIQQVEKLVPAAGNKLRNDLMLSLKTTQFEKYEYWADPPFNTRRKENTSNCLPEFDLINYIYTSQ
jgi:hypothetical protein